MRVRQEKGLDSRAELFSKGKVEEHLKSLIENKRFVKLCNEEKRKATSCFLDEEVRNIVEGNKALEPLTQPEWALLWIVVSPLLNAIDKAKKSIRNVEAEWTTMVLSAYHLEVYDDDAN